jgi:hypothetical protein
MKFFLDATVRVVPVDFGHRRFSGVVDPSYCVSTRCIIQGDSEVSTQNSGFLSRREAVKTAAIGTLLAIFGGGGSEDVATPVDTRRTIWRWDEQRQQWDIVRMAQLKKGDTFEIEASKGSNFRLHCEANSNPFIGESGEWEIYANGHGYNFASGESVDFDTAWREYHAGNAT